LIVNVAVAHAGAARALLKTRHLTQDPAATLRKVKGRDGDVRSAYTLKGSFHAIFAGEFTLSLDPRM
jgi:hypothetical protein